MRRGVPAAQRLSRSGAVARRDGAGARAPRHLRAVCRRACVRSERPPRAQGQAATDRRAAVADREGRGDPVGPPAQKRRVDPVRPRLTPRRCPWTCRSGGGLQALEGDGLGAANVTPNAQPGYTWYGDTRRRRSGCLAGLCSLLYRISRAERMKSVTWLWLLLAASSGCRE